MNTIGLNYLLQVNEAETHYELITKDDEDAGVYGLNNTVYIDKEVQADELMIL